jgi:hypothetical protein
VKERVSLQDIFLLHVPMFDYHFGLFKLKNHKNFKKKKKKKKKQKKILVTMIFKIFFFAVGVFY